MLILAKKSAQNINKLKVGGARIKEISFSAAHKFDAGYSWEQEKKNKLLQHILNTQILKCLFSTDW